MPVAPPALELVGVSAAYGPYRALFDVSFEVPAGGIVALIGSNGAGKSTVSRVVSGLLPAVRGDRPARRHRRDQPARLQGGPGRHGPRGRGPGVFASLTVEENLKLAFRQRAGRRAVAESLDRAYEAFPLLGARRGQHGGTLSGGEQRILSLAKVLVVPPRVLVADEISLGLAPLMTDIVYDGLRRINEAGTALLIVEQQVDRVLEIAETRRRARARLGGVPGTVGGGPGGRRAPPAAPGSGPRPTAVPSGGTPGRRRARIGSPAGRSGRRKGRGA